VGFRGNLTAWSNVRPLPIALGSLEVDLPTGDEKASEGSSPGFARSPRGPRVRSLDGTGGSAWETI
jgi:hypothetical protein